MDSLAPSDNLSQHQDYQASVSSSFASGSAVDPFAASPKNEDEHSRPVIPTVLPLRSSCEEIALSCPTELPFVLVQRRP
jgi:hypothetical protein